MKMFLFFIIGVLLAVGVVNYFGFQEFITTLSSSNTTLFFVAILIQLLTLVLLSVRSFILIRERGYITFWRTFKITMAGLFVSLITPIAKIGGEPLKIYLLKENVGTPNATAAISIDSIVDIIVSLFVVFFTLLFFAGDLGAQVSSIFIAFLVVSFLVILFVMKILLTPRWLRKIVEWITRKIARFQNVEEKDYAKMFYSALNLMIKNKRMMCKIVFITALTKIFEFLRLFVVFLALDIFLPLNMVLIIWSVILVLMFLPWLPGGLGLLEFGAITAITFFGISQSVATSAVILDRFASFWFTLIIGVLSVYALKRGGDLASIKDIGKKVRASKPKIRRSAPAGI